MSHSHILILGGGVIGLACAWRLAQGGAHVQLLESREPGQGATLAALGALWPASPLARGPLQELHRASLWQFEGFAAELARVTGRAVSWRRLGRLELLNSSKAADRAAVEAAAACAEWPAFGAPGPTMELLGADEIAGRFPQLSRPVYPGLLCRATAQVQVPELVAALVAACQSAGVSIRSNTRVLALARAGDRVTGVVTAEGTISADSVVLATGAWTALLGEAVAAVAPVRPAKGQGLALQMPHGVRLEGIVKADSTYLIPWVERGEILVGSTTEPEAGFDEAATAEGRAQLLAGAAGILPGLRDAVVLRHWAGLRPQNPAKRHPPIMGPHPELGNLFLCTAHFKTGIGLAPVVSQLVAEAMLTGRVPEALTPFLPK